MARLSGGRLLKALKACLGLPGMTCTNRTPRSRCTACEAIRQRDRNQRRTQYRGTWRATSKAARRDAVACPRCGVPFDQGDRKRRSTLDHTTGLVLCQSCNSRLRRNPDGS